MSCELWLRPSTSSGNVSATVDRLRERLTSISAPLNLRLVGSGDGSVTKRFYFMDNYFKPCALAWGFVFVVIDM